MIDNYKIHKAKKKLEDNIGNFYVKENGFIIKYFNSFSSFSKVFYVTISYCSFKDDIPNTFLEEHTETLSVDKVEEIEFLTVEELFKRYRTKVINLYRMVSNFPEYDIYHRDKKIPWLREFSKIDGDEEIDNIKMGIEAKKFNL